MYCADSIYSAQNVKKSHYRPGQTGPEGSKRWRLPDFKIIGT